MNDTERSQWIDNDEGLYTWWKSTRLSKRAFIKRNRHEIDRIVMNMTSGAKRQHYLIYDKPKGPLNGLGAFQGDKDVGAERVYQSDQTIVRARYVEKGGGRRWFALSYGVLGKHVQIRAGEQTVEGRYPNQPLDADIHDAAEQYLKRIVDAKWIPLDVTALQYGTLRYPVLRLVHKADVRRRGMQIDGLRSRRRCRCQ